MPFDQLVRPVKDLSIIIVNWRSVDYLCRCLETIYANTDGVGFEVIVVDNDPAEKNEEVRELFPEITIISAGQNLGFAMANNFGFSHSSGRNILFLNPDTEVLGGAIAVMLSHLNSLPDAGIVGCRLLNSDGTVQTSCIQRFPTLVNQVLDIEVLRLKWPRWQIWGIWPLFSSSTQPVPVEVIPGACLMIKRDAFEKAGLFNEVYFMYAEDVDLCYKLLERGSKAYYVPGATVIHHGGGSSRRNRNDNWATVMQRHAILTFCRSTRGRLYAVCYRASMGIAAFFRLLVLVLLLPFSGFVSEDNTLTSAFPKWLAVLRWSLGLEAYSSRTL